MIKSFVIHLPHYLDERGELAPMPGPAVALALFFGSIVSWVTGWPGPHGERTNVPCRRQRDRPRCTGEIYARLTAGDAILFRCASCGEDGTISGWEGTRWDRSAGVMAEASSLGRPGSRRFH